MSGTLTAASSTFRADTNYTYVTTRLGIGTTTPATALQVIGTITADYLSVGTISASLTTHGTTTVKLLNNVNVGGTVTAAGFIGDGSQLTNVPSTVGTDSVTSSTIVDNSITGSDISNTLSMTDTTLNIGSLTVSAGNFRVDSAGSMTATTITATGSITAAGITSTSGANLGSTTVSTFTSTGSTTVSGTLTAASSTFRADTNYTYVTTRLGIGTTTPGSSYLMQVTSDGDTGVTIGSGGSMTVKTLTVTGTETVTGTLTAGNDLRVDTNTLVVDAASDRVGIGTTTPSTTLHIVGTGVRMVGPLYIGTTATTLLDSRLLVVATATGRLGTITAGYLSVGTISANAGLHGTTTVGFLGGAKFGNTVYFAETNNGSSGAAKTIDWRVNNKQRLTITANTTLTFTPPGGPANLTLVLVQGSPGTGTVTWPGSATVKWPGGTAFTVSTATSAVDIVSCYFTGTNTFYCVGSSAFR